MKKRIAVALLSLLAVMQFSASAQEVAVKTNLIYDATLTINAGVEARLAPKWTFDLSGTSTAGRSMNTIGNIGSFNPKPVIGYVKHSRAISLPLTHWADSSIWATSTTQSSFSEAISASSPTAVTKAGW